MTPIRQTWEETDAQPVRVVSHSKDEQPASGRADAPKPQRYARRMPGAIAGILLFTLIAVGSIHLLPFATGDLVADVAAVTISEAGADPQIIDVPQGGIVRFASTGTIPHVLHFEGLTDGEGNALESGVLFPDAMIDVVIPLTAVLGEYTYTSLTVENLQGRIRVTESQSIDSPSSESSITSSIESSAEVAPASSVSESAADDNAPVAVAAIEEPSASSVSIANMPVPTNPYTVAFAATVDAEPLRAAASDQATLAPSSDLHKGAPLEPAVTQHTPKGTPQSGPATVPVILLLSTIGLIVLCRRHFGSGASASLSPVD